MDQDTPIAPVRQSVKRAKVTGTRSAESIMASGHVKRRVYRPDTWQLRPAVLFDQENPCQQGAVHTWREAVMASKGVHPEAAEASVRRLSASVAFDQLRVRHERFSWPQMVDRTI